MKCANLHLMLENNKMHCKAAASSNALIQSYLLYCGSYSLFARCFKVCIVSALALGEYFCLNMTFLTLTFFNILIYVTQHELKVNRIEIFTSTDLTVTILEIHVRRNI